MSTRGPAIKLTAQGLSLTVNEWAAKTGLPHQTIRTRLRLGWSADDALEPEGSGDQYKWRTRKLRSETLAAERKLAMYAGRKPPRDVWDLPMALDPWAMGAIDAAAENPMTLHEVGHLFGVSRERIRQVEAIAIRKLQRLAQRDGSAAALVAMLRDLDTERAAHDVAIEDDGGPE